MHNFQRSGAGVRAKGGVWTQAEARGGACVRRRFHGQTASIGVLCQPIEGPEPIIRRSISM